MRATQFAARGVQHFRVQLRRRLLLRALAVQARQLAAPGQELLQLAVVGPHLVLPGIVLSHRRAPPAAWPGRSAAGSSPSRAPPRSRPRSPPGSNRLPRAAERPRAAPPAAPPAHGAGAARSRPEGRAPRDARARQRRESVPPPAAA